MPSRVRGTKTSRCSFVHRCPARPRKVDAYKRRQRVFHGTGKIAMWISRTLTPTEHSGARRMSQ